MKNRQLYTISCHGLPPGTHAFTFEIGRAFFAEFENSEVQHGALSATVAAEKTNRLLQMDVNIAGTVTVACDRCLDPLEMPIHFRGTPLVNLGTVPGSDSATDEGDDLLTVDAATGEVDLQQYFYDSIILSLPIQCVHPAGECNEGMIKKLNELKINNN